VHAGEEKWLVEKVEHLFRQAEQAAVLTDQQLRNLYVLMDALQVLGLEAAAQSFRPRLTTFTKQTNQPRV
jgi:hypothetical protein